MTTHTQLTNTHTTHKHTHTHTHNTHTHNTHTTHTHNTHTHTHTSLRIIEPLTSRCSKFRFKPLSEEILTSRLEHIAKEEGMTCQQNVISKIVEVSEGDLRKAITFMQSVSRLKGSEEVTEEDILEIAGVRE